MVKNQTTVQAPVMVKIDGRINNDSPLAVGVDVAKDTLMICWRYASGKQKFFPINNSEADITDMARELKKVDFQEKIIIESTGRHHLLCAILLSKYGLDVRVINPLITSKHSRGSIRKVKTDKKDSEILAKIALIEDRLPNTFNSGKNELKLKKKVSLINTLDKEIQKLKAAITEFKQTAKTLKIKLSGAEKQIMRTINNLEKQKKNLEAEIKMLITECDYNSAQAKKYQSIPGVSAYFAVLATFFWKKEYCQSAKQWIAFTGLDVSVRESGLYTGRGKLTKRGNGYLRKRLFQAAWGAKMHNQQFRDYYDHLIARGRTYNEALVILARKILTIMFYLCKNDTYYDSEKIKFSILKN